MPVFFAKIAICASLALFAGGVSSPVAMAQAAGASTASPMVDKSGNLASAMEVRAQTAAMLAEMKPGQGFAWRPLLRDGPRVVAIEIWKKPGRPAVHPSNAEYAIVLEGAGTLVSGGRLIAPVTSQEELIEGDRIEGGVTRPLRPGDVLLLPAGMPHWFGVTGDRLVLLGTKFSTK